MKTGDSVWIAKWDAGHNQTNKLGIFATEDDAKAGCEQHHKDVCRVSAGLKWSGTRGVTDNQYKSHQYTIKEIEIGKPLYVVR